MTDDFQKTLPSGDKKPNGKISRDHTRMGEIYGAETSQMKCRYGDLRGARQGTKSVARRARKSARHLVSRSRQ